MRRQAEAGRARAPGWMACVVGSAMAVGACANDALLDTGAAARLEAGAGSAAADGGSSDAVQPDASTADARAQPPLPGPTPDAGDAAALGCADAAPPAAGLALWLRAGVGYTDDGMGNVSAWADQAGGAPATAPSDNQRPTLVPNALNGVEALHFKGAPDDADQAALERAVPINGLTGLTLVFVNATDVLWKDDPTEWCHYAGCDADPSTQMPGVRKISETGCSGTYQHVLWWNGLPDPSHPGSAYDWSGVFLSPKQEGIGFRFGNKVETYSQDCCDIPYDENVEWHRPSSIDSTWTETIAVHDGLTNRLYADGVMVHQLPAPGGGDPAVYADDILDIGNGFGWVDSHNHGGLVAEVMVYTRALSTPEIADVDRYLDCNLFPDRLTSP